MNKIQSDNLTRAGRGRPKGSQNKTTKIAKEMIAEAAEKLGGLERMVNWAKEDPLNERAFWSSIYPKLLPLQVDGALDHNVKVSGSLAWHPPQ
jgi:hypothetical protein